MLNKLLHNIKKTYKDTFNYSGRSSISEFWSFTIFAYASSFLTFFLIKTIGNDILYLIYFIFCIIFLFVPNLSLFVRRLHDFNISGKIVFVPFFVYFTKILFLKQFFSNNTSPSVQKFVFLLDVILIGFVFFYFVASYFKGDTGKNNYGVAE